MLDADTLHLAQSRSSRAESTAAAVASFHFTFVLQWNFYGSIPLRLYITSVPGTTLLDHQSFLNMQICQGVSACSLQTLRGNGSELNSNMRVYGRHHDWWRRAVETGDVIRFGGRKEIGKKELSLLCIHRIRDRHVCCCLSLRGNSGGFRGYIDLVPMSNLHLYHDPPGVWSRFFVAYFARILHK